MKIKEKAPIFCLPSSDGSEINLEDFIGKNVVLYFYPKDDTPGCTIEAQDFTRKIEEFKERNCVVFGVSKDSKESHLCFIKKYNLSINLLSDENGKVCKKYNVMKEKNMFGKKYFVIERSTFLIGKTGKISKIWRSVSVKNHVNEVLEAL
jgi:peroxiredoxin Q/BCP